MKLRFDESEILYWADRYHSPWNEEIENELTDKTLVNKVQQQKYLDINLLKKVAAWKSKRKVYLVDENSETDVREITSIAMTTTSERKSVEILTRLSGVGMPIASAVLHFFHKDPYPIKSAPVLWSIGVEKNANSITFWQKYVSFCRELAKRNDIDDMRTLDKALWQYSRENQS